MNPKTSLRIGEAVERGAAYLAQKQFSDGHWEDYKMPPGVSDTWVTAYVGWSLALVSQRHQLATALTTSELAAKWIARTSYPNSGWGFNRASGPDTDSTALALALLQFHQLSVPSGAEAFLRSAWRESGGFTTFPNNHKDGWGCPHVDVSWPAFGVLPAEFQKSHAEELIQWLERERDTDGLWRGYWWKEPYYASYHAELAARNCGVSLRPAQPPTTGWVVNGMAAAAFCAGVLNRWQLEPEKRCQLVTKLLSNQKADGSWAPSLDLRLTDRSVRPSDKTPLTGPYFIGLRGLMETAGIIRVLSQEEWI